MNWKIITLIVLMIISFFASVMFFFNSGLFDFETGRVAGENIKILNIELNKLLKSKFNINVGIPGEIHELRIFNASDIETIKVNSVSTDVYIKSVDSEVISFELKGYGIEENLVVERKGDILISSVIYPFKSIFFRNSNLKLIINIPKSYKKELLIEVVSGEVLLKDLNLENCIFETVSGDIELENVLCQKSKIETGSGRVIETKEVEVNNMRTVQMSLEDNEEIGGSFKVVVRESLE